MNSNKESIIAHMTPVDWLLVLLFCAVLAVIGGLFLPTYGWFLGALLGLGLIYLAKRRRDAVIAAQNAPDDTSEPQLPIKEDK